jgi:transcriptional regulator with XRE-family HTH domain
LEALGDALGLTYQQVQKYERGANRVGASRLFDISRVFSVPISFFFEDMPEDVGATPMSGPRGRMCDLAEEQEPFPTASTTISPNAKRSNSSALIIASPTLRSASACST